jgi:hypothetical protein
MYGRGVILLSRELLLRKRRPPTRLHNAHRVMFCCREIPSAFGVVACKIKHKWQVRRRCYFVVTGIPATKEATAHKVVQRAQGDV